MRRNRGGWFASVDPEPAPPRPPRLGIRATVHAWEQGLLFRDGVLVSRLGPGSRRLWSPRTTVQAVDLRPRVLRVPSQEVPTADGVTVKVTLAGQWRVTDPVRFVTGHEDPLAALYLAVQVALRDTLAATAVDEVVSARDQLRDRLLAAVQGLDDLGVVLDRLEIRDVVLPADLKRARAQVLIARAEGQAALERARAETAALRGLLNAARLVAEQPALVQLRLLQQAATPGTTLVVGAPAMAAPVGAPDRPAEPAE